MPNSFQFIERTSGKAEKFSSIDDKIRELVAAHPDEKSYYRGWYDAFGLEAAIGWSFERMILERISDPPADDEIMTILQWLAANYETDAWYSPKY